MNSDPGFRAARRAGARGIRRLVFPLVFLVFLWFFARSFLSGDSTIPLVVAGLAALIVLFNFFTEARRLLRSRGAWSRAARGAVSLTLRGDAVAKQRVVAGRPMRTVVVEHQGVRRYLHLLFAKDAPAASMRQGPVSVEFFAGDDAEGPARLLLPDGRTLWAFTSRLGERATTGPQRRTGTPGSRSADGAAGLMAPAVVHGHGPSGDDRDQDREGDGYDGGSGDGVGDSAWSGGDGWTGGGSWGGDSTWSGSDGGSGGGGDGGGWSGDSGGGWSGGDSGGGGGDSGGGGS